MALPDSPRNASNLSSSSHQLNSVDFTAISVYISLVGGLGIVGNILVIAAFCTYRSLRTSTNTFILHLAVCNLLLALLDIIFSLPSSIEHKWILGLLACRFYGLTYHFFCSVSLNTLAIISLDRYWVITKPAIGIKITIRRALLCILLSYAYTVVFMIPVFLQWMNFHEEAFYTGCYLNFAENTVKSRLYALILGIFLFAIPFAVMIFCYGSIFISVKRKGRYAERMRPKCRSKWKFTSQRIPHWRTARMIIVVIFVFLLCWSPYVIVSLSMSFGSVNSPLTLEITLLVAKSGVIYNPFIYAALNLRFRTAFFEMLHCDRVASRSKWGVKSRVLAGATGDSSGYLTSRASNCGPSSRGLVERNIRGSLLRTIERRSSIDALEQQKTSNGEQEQLLQIEHGICCKHRDHDSEDRLNKESHSNSDKVKTTLDTTQTSEPASYCNHCNTCAEISKTRQCLCADYEGSASKCTCAYGDDILSVRGESKGDGKQGAKDEREKSSGSFSRERSSKRMDNREKSPANTDSCEFAGLTRLNTKKHSLEANAKREAVVRDRNSHLTHKKFFFHEISCSCKSKNSDNTPSRQSPPSSTSRFNSFIAGMDRKGPKGHAKGHTIFGRRTSEGFHTESGAKKGESFWRRPSLVILNNVRPISHEPENI